MDRETKIVIGNGFDLACHLKSSYKDFFNSSNSFNVSLDKWKKFRLDFDDRATDVMEELINSGCTIWDLYFYLFSQKKVDQIRWCDIEEAMLESFFSDSFNLLGLNPNEKMLWKNVYSCFLSDDEDCEYENVSLLYYYIKQHFRNKNPDRHTFDTYLLDQLKLFEKRFGAYIEEEEKNNLKYKDNAAILLNKMVDKKNETIISVESFNYSKPFFEEQFSMIRNINGDTKCPIFGIDTYYMDFNDNQNRHIEIDSEEYAFTKTARRLMEDIENPKEFDEIPFSDLIIYGHSLNRQDYSYFYPLFDYLKLTDASSTGRVIFAYSFIDGEEHDETTKRQYSSISSIFSSYEDYFYSGTRKEKRLIDSLSAEKRLIIRKIDTDDLSCFPEIITDME